MVVVSWTNVIAKDAMNVVRFWIYSDMLTDWLRVLEKEKAFRFWTEQLEEWSCHSLR